MFLSLSTSGIWQDFRYAGRLWRTRPIIAFLAVAAIATGIGAVCGIFSILNAVLIAPLPYREPDRLVMIWNVNEREGLDINEMKRTTRSLSLAEYHDWRSRSDIFEGIMAFSSQAMQITHTNDPGIILVYRLSAGAFSIMGVQPILGRGFEPRDEQPSDERVIVLQHHVWQQKYLGKPDVIGQQIHLNNVSYTIIGVMPRDFVMFNRQMDAMVPAHLQGTADLRHRGTRSLRAMARLKQGLTTEQAQARADSFSAVLSQSYPTTNRHWHVMLVPISDDATEELRLPMLLLLIAVTCVVLITCANVASLLLVQASARSKELVLRTALGASRFRLVRQIFLEGLMLAITGGIFGLGIGLAVVTLFRAMLPDRTTHGKYLVQAVALRFDLTVIGFGVLATFGVACAIALIPAWKVVSKPNLKQTLDFGTRGSTSISYDRRVRGVLVVCEIALATLLAIGSTLLVRSLVELYQRGPGFEASGLIALGDVRPSTQKLDEQLRHKTLSREEEDRLYIAADQSFRHRLYDQLERVSGLRYTTASRIPLSGTYALTPVVIEGREAKSAQSVEGVYGIVRAGYFRLMGIPFIKGRDFISSDSGTSQRVVIVSQEFVRRYLPNVDSIGVRVKINTANPTTPWLTIIGVCGDVREDGMDQPPQPMIYVSEDQVRFAGSIIFRAENGDTAPFASVVRTALRSVDPEAAVYRVIDLESEARGSAWKLNYSSALLSGLAALAVILAGIGVYGLLSYTVGERTHEIGVRMALGADRRQVLALVVGEGLMLVGVGVVLGLIAASGLTRFVRSLLFGVAPFDFLSFFVVSLVLFTAGGFASYMPARRAAKMNPLVALRY